jgi:hypothetical protein
MIENSIRNIQEFIDFQENSNTLKIQNFNFSEIAQNILQSVGSLIVNKKLTIVKNWRKKKFIIKNSNSKKKN